jgi:hypothetical protein
MKRGALYLAEAPDWFITQYAEFLQFMNEEWGVPLVSSVKWESYPDSYGAHNGVRLGDQAWLGYHGFLAHQHVANNLHGDVLIPVTRILEAATGTGDDMAFTEAELRKFIREEAQKALGDGGNNWVNADALLPPGSKSTDQISPVGMILQSFNKLSAQLKALQLAEADDATLAQVVQALNDKLGTGTQGALTKDDLKQALVEVFHSADTGTSA